MAVLRGAIAYWALVFALGFMLGTLRVLWGAAALGETTFLLIEISVLLGASWIAARWLTRRLEIATTRDALTMGMFAFALLMLAELLLASTLGEGARAWLASRTSAPGLYGLLGQAGFALMPWLSLRLR